MLRIVIAIPTTVTPVLTRVASERFMPAYGSPYRAQGTCVDDTISPGGLSRRVGDPAPSVQRHEAHLHLSEIRSISRERCARDLSRQSLAARGNLMGWALSRATLSKIESRLRRVNDAKMWLLGAEMRDLFPPGSRRRPPASLVAVARHSED